MDKIKEVIVVEGRDDTKRVHEALNADTFETNGSALSLDDLNRLVDLQAKRGLIVLTDPDFNGERIRKMISQKIPEAKHAFISRQAGVPKNRGGSLGVEHADPQVIRDSIQAAHVSHALDDEPATIQPADLIQAHLVAHPQAKQRRIQLGEILGIGYVNGKQLLRRLQMFQITADELQSALEKLIRKDHQMKKATAIGNYRRTREILEKHGIHAKKGFGQNFLTDLNVLNGIAQSAHISKEDNVIEIGPGIGALTEVLAKAANQVVALEIDGDLLPVLDDVLAPYDNVKVLHQDVLKANLPELVQVEFTDPTKPIKVVANLPYYITSPILMGLLSSEVVWDTICVMMQKEVAERLTAKPGTKAYGALTLAIEYQMQAKVAFNVSRRSFIPAPNVDSAIVVLTPRKAALPVQHFDQKRLFGLIRGCFAHRRKSLWNNLKSLMSNDKDKLALVTTALENVQIDPQTRPEQLTLNDFIRLANALHDQAVW